jgi:hypothetical protein
MSAKNEFADVHFKACEYEDGTPYIGTDENGPETNSVLNEKLSLSLQLKKGTSLEEARTIVNYLNQHIIRMPQRSSKRQFNALPQRRRH